jgi:hypothetical protein
MAHRYFLRSASKRHAETNPSKVPATTSQRRIHRVSKTTAKEKFATTVTNITVKQKHATSVGPLKSSKPAALKTEEEVESKSPDMIEGGQQWITIYSGRQNLVLLRDAKTGFVVYSRSRDCQLKLEFLYHRHRLIAIWERDEKTWEFLDEYYLGKHYVSPSDIDSVIQSIEYD